MYVKAFQLSKTSVNKQNFQTRDDFKCVGQQGIIFTKRIY